MERDDRQANFRHGSVEMNDALIELAKCAQGSGRVYHDGSCPARLG
jgi:hypothetical protein